MQVDNIERLDATFENGRFILMCPNCADGNESETGEFLCPCGCNYILTVCQNCESEIGTLAEGDEGECPVCHQKHTDGFIELLQERTKEDA